MLTGEINSDIVCSTELNFHRKGGERVYRKLRGRIIEMFGTYSKFADELKVSASSVSLKLNGQTEFSREDMIRWGELLKIEVSDFGDYFFA